jgi:hypothetical protein
MKTNSDVMRRLPAGAVKKAMRLVGLSRDELRYVAKWFQSLPQATK